MAADGEGNGDSDDAFALVFCPRWSHLPPISLAYVKGAISNRHVDCFDFNHEFYKLYYDDYCFVFDGSFAAVQPFMMADPDFDEFEASCKRFAAVHAPVVEDWVARLAPYKVVGLSVYQENVVAAAVLARALRRRYGTICIAGGPTVNMDNFVIARHLLADATIAVGVLGIAEDVIEELLSRLYAGRNFEDIPGLVYRKPDGKVAFTPPKRHTLIDVSTKANYDDFDLDDYFKGREDWISLYAIIGCLASCEFCTIHEFYPKFWKKDVQAIKDEMLFLRERYGRHKIFFSDSMFLGDKRDAVEIFDFAVKNGFELGLQIRLMLYWDDEDLVRLASRCVYYLQIGLESGSPNV